MTTRPDEAWMLQVSRNLLDEAGGGSPERGYLIIDRHTKYSKRFRDFVAEGGAEAIRQSCERSPSLPPALNTDESLRRGRFFHRFCSYPSLCPFEQSFHLTACRNFRGPLWGDGSDLAPRRNACRRHVRTRESCARNHGSIQGGAPIRRYYCPNRETYPARSV